MLADPPCEVRLHEKYIVEGTDQEIEHQQWFRFMPRNWQRPTDEKVQFETLPYIQEGSVIGECIIGRPIRYTFAVEVPAGNRRIRIIDIRPLNYEKTRNRRRQ